VTGGSPAPVELTGDPAFARRVQRLALTSAVVLGIILWLATATVPGRRLVAVSLLGGWILMPSLLWLSLRWPRLRYGLVLPSFLVSAGLLVICFLAPPPHLMARAGWWLVAAGVLLGGVLGMWLWFRWLPVPATLTHPFSPARWRLIAIHIGLIVVGLLFVTVALL
jgi:hypothetical protein